VKAVLGFMNWMVPSTIRVNFQAAQANLVGLAATEANNFVGFMLMPTWVCNRGQLWMSETAVLKSLASQNLNLDKDRQPPNVLYKACPSGWGVSV
jgi:hypothetical protein